MKAWLIPVVLGLSAQRAHADQCAWLDRDVAAKATTLLHRYRKVIEFCEPCGDQAPGVPYIAERVDVTSPEDPYREVRIDDRPVDLAYVYVKTTPTEYANLAALAGCETTGVSASLSIAAETPHGVLITAGDAAPVAAPPIATAVRPAPVVPLAQPAAAPSPNIYVIATTPRERWSVIAAALAAGFLLGATSLIALGMRRRRDMRPRATDLR